MFWKDRCLAFVKKYGKAAKSVAGGVLNVVAPGSGTLLSLVELACDKAIDTAQDHWEQALLEATQNNAAELQRLGQLFDLLSGELAGLCDKAAAFADRPDRLPDAIREAIAADPALARACRRIDEILVVVAQTHGAVLDLQAEQQRLGSLHLDKFDEILTLLGQVVQQLSQAGMRLGEVRAKDSCSIRGEDERRAVRALLVRFRSLPAADQKRVPALLNGLGKLQLGAGDFAAAGATFAEVAAVVAEPAGKAEASHNAYRVALEERKYDVALAALQRAAEHDGGRFAPFPLHRSEPRRILGAGGFGTAVLCLDRHFNEEVVVKTLHAADLERDLGEVFREARTLRRLSHAAIIGVRDCDYADARAKARPFLVMEYFPGGTLEQFVEQRGPLKVPDLVAVADQIARGMQAAHGQGVLHRDLKPANVLVRKEGDRWQVKVIDFGLALRKQVVETSMAVRSAGNTVLSDSVAGTLKYAPPEQLGELRGVKPGPYSDVYAFGKTCCYALFKTTEPRSRHLEGLPAELRKLLEGCIEQELEHRIAGFDKVLPVLEALDPANEEALRQREEQERQRQEEERGHREQQEATRQREAKRQEQERQERELAPLRQGKIGQTITNKLGMKFAWVPPGDSWLGGGDGKPGTQKFTLKEGLWCGVYPVTQAEWQAVMGNNPSHFKGNPRYPVESVSWNDVRQFIEKLNQQTSGDGLLYRLPTEPEWEYICRGGPISQAQSAYHFYFARSKTDLTPAPTNDLSSTQANFDGNYPAGSAAKGPYLKRPCEVGLYLPNPLGIYDLHGNVWEWTSSQEGSYRVSQGGCWRNHAAYCTASYHYWLEPGDADGYLGCRLLAVSSGK